MTGDCLTTVHFTRLPYHRVIQQRPSDEDQVLADLCRSANVYEIVKIKDFDDCRIDPLQTRATPGALRLTYSSNGEPAPQVQTNRVATQVTTRFNWLVIGYFAPAQTLGFVQVFGLR